jgi:hypothetical protein
MSMHIIEEVDKNYLNNLREMIDYVKEIGFKIICDVSKHSLEVLKYNNLVELTNDLNIDVLRIDYGYTVDEINIILDQIPLCLNASTISRGDLGLLNNKGKEIFFIHNFYPHTDTGLDIETYTKQNDLIIKYGYKVISFISSDNNLRGPVFDGLVTLENHRFKSPYYQALDYYLNYNQEMVFVGDSILSKKVNDLILEFINNGIISIPAMLDQQYNYLYDLQLSIRSDSPLGIKRIVESREYSRNGRKIKPSNSVERIKGSITIDNELYTRYSGEVMICVEKYKQDARVNVIGQIEDNDILKLIQNDTKIKFVKSIL